jgi:hypothetical protein
LEQNDEHPQANLWTLCGGGVRAAGSTYSIAGTDLDSPLHSTDNEKAFVDSDRTLYQRRTLKLARTLADLAGSERIEAAHLAQAVQYTRHGKLCDLARLSVIENFACVGRE